MTTPKTLAELNFLIKAMRGFVFFNYCFVKDSTEITQDALIKNKWSVYRTVRGFNAHHNKWVTFTNLELEVEGLLYILYLKIKIYLKACLLCLCLISTLRCGFRKVHRKVFIYFFFQDDEAYFRCWRLGVLKWH